MGTCLFCQKERKLTGEHVLSDWISNYILRAFQKSVHVTAPVSFDELTGRQVEGDGTQRIKAGDVQSRKLKIVCSECNNGWMSAIVERAKPHLLPLLFGQWAYQTPEAREAVAAWAVLSTMVWERSHPETAATDRHDLDYMRTDQKPTERWRVWIGTSATRLETAIHHRGALLVVDDDDRIHGPCNTQVTVIAIGHLMAVTARCPFALNLYHFAIPMDRGVVEIWPKRNDGIVVRSITFAQQSKGLALIEAITAVMARPSLLD
jgi:hypothetical protein